MKWIPILHYLCHAFLGNRDLLGVWLFESTHVFFQCTALLNPFNLLGTKLLQICKALSIVILLKHFHCYPWNIKEKFFDNEAIVPNEMKPVEVYIAIIYIYIYIQYSILYNLKKKINAIGVFDTSSNRVECHVSGSCSAQTQGIDETLFKVQAL